MMTFGLLTWMAAIYACYKLFRAVKNWRLTLSVFAAAAAVTGAAMLLENRLGAGGNARQIIEGLCAACLTALAGELLVLYYLRRDWRKYAAAQNDGKSFGDYYAQELSSIAAKR